MLLVHGKYAILMSALMTLLKIPPAFPPPCSREYFSFTLRHGFKDAEYYKKGKQYPFCYIFIIIIFHAKK